MIALRDIWLGAGQLYGQLRQAELLAGGSGINAESDLLLALRSGERVARGRKPH